MSRTKEQRAAVDAANARLEAETQAAYLEWRRLRRVQPDAPPPDTSAAWERWRAAVDVALPELPVRGER